MAHQKHPDLNKSNNYKWHPCEWSIYGTVCVDIEAIVSEIAKTLYPIKVGYLDESHDKEGRSSFAIAITQSDALASVVQNRSIDLHDVKRVLADVDILLVNGNHHKASRQIIFQDERKYVSLSKKLDRLTKIDILIDGPNSKYDFLQETLDRDQPSVLPNDIATLAQNIKEKWEAQTPSIKGLVLAGGKSTRMGTDKGKINYHGMSQRAYVSSIMTELNVTPYLSLRNEEDKEGDLDVIADTFQNLGPMGGILSAFRAHPDEAWLTVACDLPYLSKETLSQLITLRDPSKVATCFHNEETGFPEPLITIWEPRAYQRLLMFLAQGYACPRKVLINSDVKQIEMSNKLEMTNVNTPDEKEKFEAYKKR